MKKLIIAAVIGIYFLSISVLAQVRPGLSANNHSNASRAATPSNLKATRSRVIANNATNNPLSSANAVATLPVISKRPRIALTSIASTGTSTVNSSTAPTQTYRVGIGDILDIQIPDSLSTKSTLYTVTEGGYLDYPLVGSPLPVAGLTTDVIAQRLRSSIKVLDNPQINVRVRDFASHAVSVIGFVSAPGTKILRREAVPLYVVLSEATPLKEASSVTIVRSGNEIATINLHDSTAMSQLVVANDILKVSSEAATVQEFIFAGGEVNAPGQKPFHIGLTLTQAILASGGTSQNAGVMVRVSRQSNNGLLTTADYNLRNIQNGKAPDPLVQRGDRIEVDRNN